MSPPSPPGFTPMVGRSFHQPGMVNENVLESDFEPLCDGTMRRRSQCFLDKMLCRMLCQKGPDLSDVV